MRSFSEHEGNGLGREPVG